MTPNNMKPDCHSEREPGCSLPPSYMDDRVKRLRWTFKRDNIDFDAPCTSGQGNHCWILVNLTPWNKILHPASMELKEYEPGKLALNALDLDVHGCFDDGFLLDASYITYWLVREHRCVQFLKLHPLMVARSTCALKKALASNAGLRHFEFQGSNKWQHEETYFAEGISTLTGIESLKLERVNLRHSSVALIAKMLENSKNIKGITFSQNSLSLHSSETLLRTLRNSMMLTELAFESNLIGRKGIKYLSQLVARSRYLKKLSLKWRIKAEQDGNRSLAQALRINDTLEEIELYGCDGCTRGVANALEVNAVLKVVTLMRCDICDLDATRIATMLKKNSTLRELDIAYNKIGDAGAEALAVALRANTTLEKLCLSGNNISSHGVRQLFAALTTNCSLRVLDFDWTSFRPEERPLLNAALCHAQAFGRVRMTWEDADLTELTAAVAAEDELDEVHLRCTSEMSGNSLRELFLALGCSRSVKKLTLRGHHVEVPLTKLVAEAIKTTESIEYLTLDYLVRSHTDVKDLMKALRQNRSIVSCNMEFSRYNNKIAKAIATLLCENTTISSLVIRLYPPKGKPLDILSKALSKNCTLTRLKLGSNFASNKATFRIGEALRRNLSLLNRAAHFVMTPFKDKDVVQIFERLAESKNLLRHLVHLTRKEEQEVKGLICAAKGYIALNYFAIIGVVKEHVRCHPVSPYRTQIDQLDEECWKKVLSYLKVSDVILV